MAQKAYLLIVVFLCVLGVQAEELPRMAEGIIDTTDANSLGLPKSEHVKTMVHNGKIYVGYSTNKEDVDCTIIPIE